MKITLREKECELKLTTIAVEKIEDKFGKPFGELFADGKTLMAKDMNIILHCMADTEMSLEEFRVELAKGYTYPQCTAMLADAFEIKNDETEKEQSLGTDKA